MKHAYTTLLLAALAAAQEPETVPAPQAALPPVQTTVGMIGHVRGVVLPGSEFEPIEAAQKSKIVVRVEYVQKHGTANRYDLEFTAFEKGEYDLATCLRRKDRTENGPLPTIPIVVTEVRNQEQNEPNALGTLKAPRLGGYETTMWVLATAWVVGFVLIAFLGKKKKKLAAPPQRQLTLADRLRPIVEQALAGTLLDEQRAELERLLLSHWRSRLQLEDRSARDAMRELREHPEGGAVLRALEQWLHSKDPQPVDKEALLRPYATVRDSDGELT